MGSGYCWRCVDWGKRCGDRIVRVCARIWGTGDDMRRLSMAPPLWGSAGRSVTALDDLPETVSRLTRRGSRRRAAVRRRVDAGSRPRGRRRPSSGDGCGSGATAGASMLTDAIVILLVTSLSSVLLLAVLAPVDSRRRPVDRDPRPARDGADLDASARGVPHPRARRSSDPVRPSTSASRTRPDSRSASSRSPSSLFQWQGIRTQLLIALPVGTARCCWSAAGPGGGGSLRQRRFGHYVSRAIVVGHRDDVEYVIARSSATGSSGYLVVGATLDERRPTRSIGRRTTRTPSLGTPQHRRADRRRARRRHDHRREPARRRRRTSSSA